MTGSAAEFPVGRRPASRRDSDPVGEPVVEQNYRVPMRDGVELALDLVRPDITDPLPVILTRTPYDKTMMRTASMAQCRRLAQAGYIVAFSDCRGRFNSDGEFFPYVNEHDDGFDTIEWIAQQDWCDGNVGMLGGSYNGQVQWQAASRVPPHLKAIVPLVSPPSSLWRNEPIFNGTLRMCMGEWMVGMGHRSWHDTSFAKELFSAQRDYFEALPVSSLGSRAGVNNSWWREMLEHPTLDDFWKRGEYDHYRSMKVAALNVTGWWDMNFPGAPLNFEAMRRDAATEEIRAGQKLVIGPWPHHINQTRVLSGVDFGEDAVVDLDGYIIRFFDRYLKGVENSIDDELPVHVFVVGANEWWAEEDWPLPDTEEIAYYLHSGGRANTLNGDGWLSTEPPSSAEPADEYAYDPSDPVRVAWQLEEGPVDDRASTTREGVLCYTTEPLAEPLDVVGWVRCHLVASSSAPDTDWHVRLVDVHPDGSARFLCHGALRARFRDSFEEPTLLTPGEPTTFEFTMDAVGVRFLPGHRIRVEVASSWFTQYDRNMNGGAENPFQESEPHTAVQRIYHQPQLASHVVLPVIHRRQ
ncbi:CocE/NonD family hydrolase [Nocardioides sp. BYT-33-1]|uniref:CocE/NonD family hydrolase n=1 Tax=Nocardioides sp. BYT-33-1 TaxID=3416952 RepID=UPI003F537BD8